jgi:hypothetical protein
MTESTWGQAICRSLTATRSCQLILVPSTVANGDQTPFEGQRLPYRRDGRASKGAGANDLP